MYDLQKASLLKRVSAFLLDFILVVIVATGFAWLISIATNFSATSDSLQAVIDSYQEQYGVNYDISMDEYEKFTEEEKKHFDETYQLIRQDKDYIYLSNKIFTSLITIVSLSLFAGIFIIEFLVPLFFKNGQTLGKKVFAIAVMRIDGVKVTPLIMFVRAILGKYTLETMIPVVIVLMMSFGVGSVVTLAVLILIVLFELGLLIFTKTNSLIHDVLSSSVVVDFQSQMIFDSVAAREEYRLRIHREEVQKADY